MPDQPQQDEFPYGREADRGLFVEGLSIVARGIDEWHAEARANGKHRPTVAPEDEGHPYVVNVFSECSQMADRLMAEGVAALNGASPAADTAVAATIEAQARVKPARAELERAQQAYDEAESEHGAHNARTELLSQGILLTFGFLLEAVLLWAALQNVELGHARIRDAVVLLTAGLMTFVAHFLYARFAIDWRRYPAQRRRTLAVAAVFTGTMAATLVVLAYIRGEDVAVIRSVGGWYEVAILFFLFLVSVIGFVLAGYAGIRHGRAETLRSAARVLARAKKAERAAVADEQRASAAEEEALARLDSLDEAYRSALRQASEIAVEVANVCLGAEGRGFTAERAYTDECEELAARTSGLCDSIERRHDELRQASEQRRREAELLHT